MGDMKHMEDIGEQAFQEEEEIIAEDEGLHPPTLEQGTPWPITVVFTTVIHFLASNGWYAVGVAVVAAVLWRMFSPKIGEFMKKREDDREAVAFHKDPDKFLARERAMDEARRRLQERYSQHAAEHAVTAAEKQKEKDDQRRQERIEDWERHQRGEGYRSKSRLNAANATPSVPAATSSGANGDKKKKPLLRPDYNPMTGDIGGDSCRWRPDRRGASGGG